MSAPPVVIDQPAEIAAKIARLSDAHVAAVAQMANGLAVGFVASHGQLCDQLVKEGVPEDLVGLAAVVVLYTTAVDAAVAAASTLGHDREDALAAIGRAWDRQSEESS